MAKSTRIFNVEYYIQEVFKGRKSGDPYKQNKNVVAKDAHMKIGEQRCH